MDTIDLTSPFPILKRPLLAYSGHLQNLRWLKPVGEGYICGTVGKALRLEAIRLWYQGPGVISMESYVQNIGWMPPTGDGEICGTTGCGLRMEAIKIQILKADNMHIEYQVFQQNKNWSDWYRDGQVAGVIGKNLRLEAIRMRLSFDN
ncbi:hypothetical protein WA158_002473 [Blastocystis sp. Blastoise]